MIITTLASKWEELSAEQRLSRAITRLVITQPVFGQLIGSYYHQLIGPDLEVETRSGEKISLYRSCQTACTNGETIFYNPNFVEECGATATEFLIMHETLHNLLGHHFRRQSRTHTRWNVATDIVINDTLLDSLYHNDSTASLSSRFPNDAIVNGWDAHRAEEKFQIPSSQFRGASGEEVYGWLPDIKEEGGLFGGSDNSISEILSNDQAQCRGVTPQDCIQEQAFKLVKVFQTTKTFGHLPALLEQLVNEWLEPQVDYMGVLREFLSRDRRGDFSYARRSRRQESYPEDTLIQGIGTEKRGGKIVVGFDTSGSIYSDTYLIDEMMAEVRGIQKELEVELVILYCDSRVTKEAHFSAEDTATDAAYNDPRFKTKGGGGTSFVPVFQWAKKHAPDADCIIYFTDLAGSFPAGSNTPTLWITHSKEKADFGTTLYVKPRHRHE